MAGEGSKLATGWLELTVTTAGAQRSMSDAIIPGAQATGDKAGGLLGGGLLGGVRGALGPVAAITGAAFGTAAIIGWGKAQIDELKRIETINAQSASVIESTGGAAGVTADHVQSLASRLEGLTATEGESIQEGANLLLTFKNIQNGVGDGNDIFDQATGSLVDMARAMGQEPAAAAVQLGKALNDPVAGISALSRVGIQFTDDQKGLIQSLVDSGQTMEAQKIILGELNSQFGGSGQAYADTYAGKIDLLGHAWGGFGEQIFSVAMPAIGSIASLLTNLLNNVLTPFVANVQGGFQIVSAAFRGVQTEGDILEPSIAGPLMRIGETLRIVFDQISAVAGPILQTIGSALGDLFTALGPLIPQFLELWTSISPLSLVFQAIQPFLPQLLAAFGQLATAVGGALLSALQQLMPVFQTLAGIVVGVLGQALQALLPIVVQVISIIGPLFQTVLGALMPLITTLAGIFGQLLTAVMPLIAPILGLISPLVELVGAILGPLVQLFAALLTPILALVGPLVGLLVPVLQFLVGVLAAIVQGVVGVITWIVQLVTGTGDAGAQLGAVWAFIQQVFTVAVGLIVGTITGFVTNTIGMFTDFGANLAAGAQLIWSNVTGFFSAGVTGIVQFFTDLPGNIMAALGDIGSLLLTAGQDLIQGFIDGITGMLDGVGDAVGGVMDFVGDFFPHSPAKRGPLSGSGWTDILTSGAALGDQYAAGILGARGGVQAAMTQLTSGVVPPARFIAPDTAQYATAPGSTGGAGGRPIEVHMHGAPGMSERNMVDAAVDRLNFDANVLGVLG